MVNILIRLYNLIYLQKILMAIYITDEIKPNGNSFPIADANNLKGGWHTVNTFSDLSKIHLSKLIDGMPCYVKDTKKTY